MVCIRLPVKARCGVADIASGPVANLAGVSIDCSDPGQLLEFYLRLLGGRVLWNTVDSAAIEATGSERSDAFYRRPVAQSIPELPQEWPKLRPSVSFRSTSHGCARREPQVDVEEAFRGWETSSACRWRW
jgi:hypothetical protein